MKGYHQIQHLCFDIEVPYEQGAQEQLRSLESIIKRRLLSTIENVFEEFSSQSRTLKLETLNLELGEIDIYDLDADLEYKLRQVLKDKLKIIIEGHPILQKEERAEWVEDSEREQEWLQTFLKIGIMPWWNQSTHYSYQQIQDRILKWNDNDPQHFKRFVLEHLSLPQVVRRLSHYTSPQFIKSISLLDTSLVELYLVQMIQLVQDQGFSGFSASFPKLWAEVVKQAAERANDQSLADVVISSLIPLLQKKLSIPKDEVILWLFLSKNKDAEIRQELKFVLDKQFRKTGFDQQVYLPLSDSFRQLSKRKLWLLGETVDVQRFSQRAASKSFRMQFIDRLSEDRKMLVLKSLFPQHVKQIQEMKEWASSIVQLKPYGKRIAEQVNIFSDDELLKQLIKGSWQKKDTLIMLESMVEYVSELAAESPVELLGQARDKGLLKLTGQQATLRQLTQKLEEKDTKGRTEEQSNDWIGEMLSFLLTGRKASASTTARVDFLDKIHVAIQYLSGVQTEQLKWRDGSLLSPQQVQSLDWQKPTNYKTEFKEILSKLSVLELALIVERIKNLPLSESQKDSLRRFAFKDHRMAELLLSKEPSDFFNWLENDQQLQFTLQYVLKFDKLPLAASSLSASEFLLLISVVLKSSDWLTMVDTLGAPAQLRLISALKELSQSAISPIRIQKLQAIVGSALDSTLVRKRSSPEFKKMSERISASTLKEQVKGIVQILEDDIDKLRAEEDLVRDSTPREEPKLSDQLSEELEKLAEKEMDKSLFIQNAGIVLLGPYLPRIFDKLELLNKEGLFKDEDSQIKAIEVIHYLAFGTEEMMEYTTILNKLMVALPVTTPLETSISLNADEKALCESLLTGVIKNWSSLKSNSIDNLRGTFLIREGKLTKQEDKYLLKVEEKGFDMLIDTVPWSFKLMKYKWMKKPVFVEWR